MQQPLHFCKTGSNRFGEPITGPVRLGQEYQAVFFPEDPGWYVVVAEDPKQNLLFLGVFEQATPGARWILRPKPTQNNHLLPIERRGPDGPLLIFGETGTETIFMCRVAPETAEAVSRRRLLGRCEAKEMAEWSAWVGFKSYQTGCEVLAAETTL